MKGGHFDFVCLEEDDYFRVFVTDDIGVPLKYVACLV